MELIMQKKVYFNLFVFSFVIMGLEMTASRFVAPTFGNTVYTWGIVISIFLIGSSVGYTIGGFVADRNSNKTILLCLNLIGILLVTLIPTIKDITFPYLSPLPNEVGTTLAVTVLYLFPNLIFSIIVTVLMKVGLSDNTTGRVIGNLHTFSAVGSVLGTIVTTFWLIPVGNINTVIGILALMVFISSLYFYETKTRLEIILVVIPALFILLLFLDSKNEPVGEILYQDTSLYHEIVVYQTEYFDGKKGPFRYMNFGDNDTIQGLMEINYPDRLSLDYSKSIWEISETFRPDSQNVFMIGHGIGTLTQKFEKNGKKVKVAEIDKQVLEVSRDYFGYEGDSVVIGDGRRILSKQQNKFDVMVLDAYNNTEQIPFHLISKEFFTLTSDKLDENGLLLVNAIGKTQGDELIKSMNSTLKSVYPNVSVYSFEDKKGIQNLTFVASKSKFDKNKIKQQKLLQIGDGEIILDENTKLRNVN